MKLSNFDYHLPKELIAQYPLHERDSAQLLVMDRAKAAIKHSTFKDIAQYLCKGDLLVLNDTKVLSCRLFGRRSTGGKVEILLLNRKQGGVFNCYMKPSRLRIDEKINFGSSKVFAKITGKNEVVFNTDDLSSIYRIGVMPLPPYIKRAAEDSDNIYYQTVYAKKEGAVAAPTAGLHFTQGLIEEVRAKGVGFAHVTLHVGAGTFKPVKSDDIKEHAMEPEYFEVSESAQEEISKCRRENKRVVAVGTTSLRALESCAKGASSGYTDLFIYPGYKFKLADCLLTNFHLPKTTLFMLVCAFAGEKLAKKAYAEAIASKYRFYSYGDAMLIL
ncbi:MAG: tRNA preQ1(34) S-adenosylmethionine ribosyltransferase-isomerase QueA [Candidatus Omnitrophica bacterium]|nr:tRNA preQ1(34) S-adenosylmethionine ribosyltransferase-isomerase QueA [Candidatus Omnitrophota bacterium]